MRYSLLGFSVKYMAEYDIDMTSAAILKWFIDFSHTGKMREERIDNKSYYWIIYDGILKDMPNIKLKKAQVAKRMKKLVECKVLLHKCIRNHKGTFSYYAFGSNFINLIDKQVSKDRGSTLEDRGGSTLKDRPNDQDTIYNHDTKDKSSIKIDDDHVPTSKHTKEHIELALKIVNHVLTINPRNIRLKNKYEKTINRWANVIRLMIENDERTIDEINDVMYYAFNSEFWKSNILSAEKLRKQFDTLYVQMQNRPRKIKKEKKDKAQIEKGWGYK